jgi:hypothetical protein
VQSPQATLSPIEDLEHAIERGRRRRRKRGTFSVGGDDDEELSCSTASCTPPSALRGPEEIAMAQLEGSKSRASHVAFDKEDNEEGERRPSKASAGGSGSENTSTAADGRDKDKDTKDKSTNGPKTAVKQGVDHVVKAILADKHIVWIKPKLKWTFLKPVIRVAFSVSTEYTGNAEQIRIVTDHCRHGLPSFSTSFTSRACSSAAQPVSLCRASRATDISVFVLIVSCMVPPFQPFVQVLEIVLNTVFYTAVAWAWTCIAIAIANATRVPTDPQRVADALALHRETNSSMSQQLFLVQQTVYLQANPAIVCCVFLSVGCAILLWWKMRTAPSPATFPLVLSCILMNIVSGNPRSPPAPC